MLNFVFIPHNPTHATTQISADLFYKIKAIGSGEMEVHAHTDSEHGRAHLAPGADGVQVAYTIGDAVPTDAEHGTERQVYRSASFIIEAGMTNRKQNINLFMRWYNSVHPNLSSPWTAVKTEIVL